MLADLAGRPARPARDARRIARTLLYAVMILGAAAWAILVGLAVYGPYLELGLF